jgi:hypothetical protein
MTDRISPFGGTLSRRGLLTLIARSMTVPLTAACAQRLTRSDPGVAYATNPGDSWVLTTNRGTIQGFADKVSIGAGESVGLYVTTTYDALVAGPSPSLALDVYRLGGPDGGHAQLVDSMTYLPLFVQPPPISDAETGLISAANWSKTATLTADGWATGIYLIKLNASNGDQSYVPLVVRDDTGSHDFLFVHQSTTDQAYNNWGGRSLYHYNSSGEPTIGGSRAAVKVSFDRPFAGKGDGGGILSWELNMVGWLEANGFDVAYASDIDVHQRPLFDARVRAVLQAGHSEYWSREMRDHFEAARDRRKGLGFFTGDTGAYAIRFESSPLGDYRVEVCYRDVAKDPLGQSDPSHATTVWSGPPLNRPMHQFIGIGTNGPIRRSANWVVDEDNEADALFAGTGFRGGDNVTNLVGYEYDGMWTPGAGTQPPAGLRVLGRAHVLGLRDSAILNLFQVRFRFDPAAFPRSQLPEVGRLTTAVETVQGGITWALAVQVSASTGRWLLQYLPGLDAPSRLAGDDEDWAVFPLGRGFDEPGWKPLVRDLRADYTSMIGPVPDDLRIEALILQGMLSLAPVVLIDQRGNATHIDPAGAGSSVNGSWGTDAGNGLLGTAPNSMSGELAFTVLPIVPGGRSDLEADSVIIERDGGPPIFAAGTMQWSWGLDSYGTHIDGEGNETPVDFRLQRLTRNILMALRGSA